jgi:hypothetical protein
MIISAAKLQKNAELCKHFCKKIAYSVKQISFCAILLRIFGLLCSAFYYKKSACEVAGGCIVNDLDYFLLRVFLAEL